MMYSSRIGFAGMLDPHDLAIAKEKFKELYLVQIEARLKDEGKRYDKIVCRAATKFTECDMLLNGK